jgi:NO-binding membrane sensor protein with MHYT domain
MKTYVIITGALFGLLTVVHLWRMVEEPHLAREPWFLLLTAVSAGICLWSLRIARRKPQL